jgi:putative ABC transport system permease protein
VLKDFHYASLHHPIEPFVFDIPNNQNQHNFFDRYLAVLITPTNYRQTIAYLEDVWSAFMPNRPFEYFFMDDELEKLYRAEENLGRIAGVFSGFAIFVAAIGLLGIASFTAEARTKEIGVRKVMGATVTNIFLKLSKDFLKLVALGILLACPIAYLLMKGWLAGFAYRTEIGIQPFLLAGFLALGIAWATVSFQAVKAALANPIKSLRYE